MIRKATALALSLLFCLSCLPGGRALAGGQAAEPYAEPLSGEARDGLELLVTQWSLRGDAPSYEDYLSAHDGAARPDAEVFISATADFAQQGAGVRVGSYLGEEALLWDSQQGVVTWPFTVEQSGLYNLELLYCALPGKSAEIEYTLWIDGAVPYYNAGMLTLPRFWQNETNDFELDGRGNELRPAQQELYAWRSRTVCDGSSQYSGALLFYLEAGTHSLSLNVTQEQVALRGFRFFNEPESLSYAAQKGLWDAAGVRDSEGFYRLYEAEKPDSKSASVLFPTYDRSRESISPSHYALTRYNTLGRDTWDIAGQSVTYEVTVPDDGYYVVSFKVKQNQKRGMFSTRTLYVDGELPYAEMRELSFRNDTSWYVYTPETDGGEAYRLYLTAGPHSITLEAALGAEAEMLRRAEALVSELNNWYRQIIVITGTNADASRVTIDLNRDYYLEAKIPGLLDGFAQIAEGLGACLDMVEEIYGSGGNSGTTMAELRQLLTRLIKEPFKIPGQLENYRSSVSSMATWVLEMRSQPLEMDYFVLRSPEQAAPKAGGSLWAQLWFRLRMFLSSFGKDYNALGSVTGGRAVDVWISTSDLATTGIASGRDQAQVIKLMIDDMFTPATGIPVNVSLVNSSSVLVQAVLAGEGPDAALVVSKDTPVNLAMRGALQSLDDFPGFAELCDRFMPSALVPYRYQGKTYALPETQSYDMLFYRTDIFGELGLTPPDTWEDFYYTISVLQQSNLLTGIPENQKTFEALLYQKGGQFYTDDLSKTTFDRPEALAAFEQWTGLYAKYSLPLVFDFFNRFRSGEMPMAIMPYTQCNYLAAAAPELRGLWDFAPIPGTLRDGVTDRSETAAGTACIMLKGSGLESEVFRFMDWWTSAEAQARYGNELENLMGAAARYPTANLEAFAQLPWSRRQSESLLAQWEEVVEIPQIPGSYYIARNISFAFRAVVYNYANERETLNKYNKEVNKEIARKREEFAYLSID